jgi:hypothetical protein
MPAMNPMIIIGVVMDRFSGLMPDNLCVERFVNQTWPATGSVSRIVYFSAVLSSRQYRGCRRSAVAAVLQFRRFCRPRNSAPTTPVSL